MEFPLILYCWWLLFLCVETTNNNLVEEIVLPSKKSSEFPYLTNNTINEGINQIISPVTLAAVPAASPTEKTVNIRLPVPEKKHQKEILDLSIINTDSPEVQAETSWTTENSYITTTIGKNSKFTVLSELETTILSADNIKNFNEGINLIHDKNDSHLTDVQISSHQSYNSTNKNVKTSQETIVTYKLNNVLNISDSTSSESLISNLTGLETTAVPNTTSGIILSNRFENHNFLDTTINSQFNNIFSSLKNTLRVAQRPSFAGLGTTPPPRIKPGKPWPARPEDYPNYYPATTTNHQLITNRTQNTQSVNPQFNQPFSNPTISIIQAQQRPSFAGLGTTAPPRIKPGKPWPARPVDYPNYTTHTTNDQLVTNRPHYTQSIIPQFNKPSSNPTFPVTQSQQRPSFAGLGTTAPPRVKPGKPWPARPEDYPNYYTTKQQDPFNTQQLMEFFNTQYNLTSSHYEVSVTSSGQRPSFAGLGTTAPPPRVKPGKPWPASAEGYTNVSLITLENPELINPPFSNPSSDSAPSLNQSDPRPSFAGQGTTPPPRIKPGKPWPARPEDYANFSSVATTYDQIITNRPENPELINPPSNNPSSNSLPSLAQSDPRPSFAGLGTTSPPRIKPGKPWPARPEDYANFSSVTTTNNQIVNDRPEIPGLINPPFNNPSSNSVPSLAQSDPRPSFAGLGTTPPPRIKPGKPWPARPEDYANFSSVTTTNDQIVNNRPENPALINPPSNNPSSNSVPSLAQSDPRPSFAGLGTTPPPRIKPGKPWPARPEDYANFSSVTTTNDQIVNNRPENPGLINSPSNNPSSNSVPSLAQSDPRPSFAGLGTTPPPRIKPGKPWPARPEDHAGFSSITTTNYQIVTSRPEHPELVNPPFKSPSSDSDSLTQSDPRPSFTGLETTPPPKVKSGKSWPPATSVITTHNQIVTSSSEDPELINLPFNNNPIEPTVNLI
uniref:Adhesive plaque matrix protein-like n=1 Tax=Diabrotica virgifera virgifera TaxID=50390 RepID=A0A6P7G0N1_DIAVI